MTDPDLEPVDPEHPGDAEAFGNWLDQDPAKRPYVWMPGAWPPAWNPFEVFLLSLAIVSSVGLVEGSSGSKLLDQRLATGVVIAWGIALALGSAVALYGVFCYRSPKRLALGLFLERTGLILVGGAAGIYSFVILVEASDLNDVRWAATVQVAYAAACFYRAWQDHRAIRRMFRVYHGEPVLGDGAELDGH